MTETKYTREYITENGTSTWYYDKEKAGKNPVKVEHNYTKEFIADYKKYFAKPKKSTYIKKKDRV